MLAKRALTEEIHHRTLCFPRTTITPCNVHVLSNALVRIHHCFPPIGCVLKRGLMTHAQTYVYFQRMKKPRRDLRL